MDNALMCREVIKSSRIKFGTSGARGLQTDFTSELCTAYMTAFLDVMQQKFEFDTIFFAMDHRPGSIDIVHKCAAVAAAKSLDVKFFGVLPTPAMAAFAISHSVPCVVVTGSHIPFDRNGLKFYTPNGEISKSDETNIVNCSSVLASCKDYRLPTPDDSATNFYKERYLSLCSSSNILSGKSIGVFEHSSAGRDIYADLFRQLGAKVVSLGRSDEFVPIDTEAVSEADKRRALEWSDEYHFDVIFSTDGDGDRPLIADEKGNWLRGDILGLITSIELGVDAIATPVSCNSAIELSGKFKAVYRTRIGSPYVIDAFDGLSQQYDVVAGFEANGGYLLGTSCQYGSVAIEALPTRDALLPFFAVMFKSIREDKSISEIVSALPARYTESDRIKNVDESLSGPLINKGKEDPGHILSCLGVSEEISHVSQVDGIRITLGNKDIIHLRPSGNAPELRVYVETDSADKSKHLLTEVLKKLETMLA